MLLPWQYLLPNSFCYIKQLIFYSTVLMYTWLWSRDVNTMRTTPQAQRDTAGCRATWTTIRTWLFLAENGQEPTAESNCTVSPSAVGTATRTGSFTHFSSLTVHSHPCSSSSFVTAPSTQLCYELDLSTDPVQIWFCCCCRWFCSGFTVQL